MTPQALIERKKFQANYQIEQPDFSDAALPLVFKKFFFSQEGVVTLEDAANVLLEEHDEKNVKLEDAANVLLGEHGGKNVKLEDAANVLLEEHSGKNVKYKSKSRIIFSYFRIS